MFGINTLVCDQPSFISRFYGGEPPDIGSFQPRRAEMHMKYDSHVPEKNPVHKDVAPATQSGSHVPFRFFIPQVKE